MKWTNTVLKLLKILETVLPSFLLVYVESLKAKIQGLEGKLAVKDRKLTTLHNKTVIRKRYHGKNTRDVINMFLRNAAKKRSTKSDKTEN